MIKNILIIAGEASGDLHGASLIRELKKLDNDISITGIGGNKMKAQGMELLFHINQMAFLGFAEVVKHIPFIRKVQEKILDEVIEKQIKTAVLIDYPGFNLNIAGKLKEQNVEIIYYIAPQVWAWGLSRMKKIKRLVSKMLVVFPFEEKIFLQSGVNAEYIGHPLLEQIRDYPYLDKESFFRKFNLDKDKGILLLLPGSRLQEVKKIFPEVIAAAERLCGEFNLQTIVACSPDIDESIFSSLTDIKDFRIIKDHTYDLYKFADFGIIKSGTSTLEAGLFTLPMIVVYTTNYLTYLIGRSVIKIDNIALVNIVAGEKIVTELIQNDVNPVKIYEESALILSDPERYQQMKNKFSEIRDKLGMVGASKKGADIIHSYITRNVAHIND